MAQFLPHTVFRLTLLAAAWCLIGAAPVSAQENSGVYLRQAFKRVTGNADLVKKLGGYGYRPGVSILGAWIHPGEKTALSEIPLKAGTTYLFLAGGDQDAEDVDLEIQDLSGKVLAADVRTAPDAVVEFTPKETGKYCLEVTLFKSRGNLPCVCVAVMMEKGGRAAELAELDTAAEQMVVALTAVDRELRKGGKQAEFHAEKGQWALFGAVLNEKEAAGVGNMHLGQGPRLFVAAGDRHLQKVGLYLSDAKNAKIKQSPQSNAPAAVFAHQPGEGAHGLDVVNHGSARPSVVMMAVFDIRE